MNLNRLKDLREDRDLLQKEIANILEITQQQYSKYELQEREIPARLIYKLALFYSVSSDYILGLTNISKAYPRAQKR